MKALRFSTLIIMIVFISFSCKKKKTPPQITLLGDSVIQLCIGDSLVDPGATSIDAYDVDLSSSIEVASNVDVQNAGSYIITYTSSDANGNISTLEREVNISICVSNLIGDYSLNDDCDGKLSNDHEISAGVGDDVIIIDDIFDGNLSDYGSVTATLSTDSLLTVVQQDFNLNIADGGGSFTISGIGVINSNATQIVFDYSWQKSSSWSTTDGICTVTYTK